MMTSSCRKARRHKVEKVVHIGSCHAAHPGSTAHPEGEFYSAEVRRPDGSIYAVSVSIFRPEGFAGVFNCRLAPEVRVSLATAPGVLAWC